MAEEKSTCGAQWAFCGRVCDNIPCYLRRSYGSGRLSGGRINREPGHIDHQVGPGLVWEGTLTAAAVLVSPFLSDVLIADLSAVGSVLIFGVGVNLLFDKGIKVGNLLPALLGPVVFHMIF